MQAKPLIGLRAGADLSIDSDDFYSESSFNEPVPAVRVSQSLTCVLLMPTAEGRINDINDISPHISAFLESYKTYTNPTAFPAEISFIPENIVPNDLTRLLADFVIDPSDDSAFSSIINWDSSEFPDAILAQIDILRFYREIDVDLNVYTDKKIDSRILALVHFALGTTSIDPHCAVYHTMVSLEEYVKFPTVAAIAKLFPTFTIDDLVRKLCYDLINLFPRHPFLPSIVHNLADAIPTVADVVDMLPPEEVSDHELSDSFFEELRSLREMNEKQPQFLQGLIRQDSIVNPLDCVTLANTMNTVTLSEPPHMVTYLLDDGTDELTPMQFENWIMSIRCERCEAVQCPVPVVEQKPQQRCANSYQASRLMSATDPLDNCVLVNEPVEFYLDLIRSIDSFDIKKQGISNSVPPPYYSVYLPVLHAVNVTKETIELTGSLYTNMLTMERDGHLALKSGDIQRIERSINYFKRQVTTETFETTPIVEQETKRLQPPLVVDLPPNFVSAMAIVNYEMMVNGRSPLSLEIFGGEVQITEENEKLASRQWRSQYLWHLYSTGEFSPYILFRLAFALAVNLSETSPEMSCNLLFEGLYVLLNGIPSMKKYPCVRAALLLFGRTLDRLNSYYYCAIVLDNFFLTDIRNASYSSEIAQVAQRNRDVIRALFHYNQALKNFVAHETTDPAIYVGQNVATIYTERAMFVQAMSILTFLLGESYDIPIEKKREKMEVVALGSLRLPPRAKAKYVSHGSVFRPDPSNVSTALTGVSLVALFGKLRLYSPAYALLDAVCSHCTSPSIQKLFSYVRMWLYHRRNDYDRLLEMIPKIELTKPRAAFLSHMGILTPNSLDTTLAIPRLMTRIHLNQKQYQKALFWSEMFIQVSRNVSVKDLGNAFSMRGLALLFLARSGVSVCFANTDVPPKVGAWITDRKLSRTELIEEALSSFYTAQFCYLRVGSYKKLVHCRLWLADIVMSETVTPRAPRLFTKAKVADTGTGPKFDYSPIDLLVLTKEIDKLVSQLMHPCYIIHGQLLMARYNLLKNEIESAKKRFEFAMNNFVNLFVCGNYFLPDDLRLKTLHYSVVLAKYMCRVLMEFDTDFINDRLFCFDIMNSVNQIYQERLRVIDCESQTPISRSCDLSPIVLDLENPLVPTFGPLLIDNGFIDENTERETLGYNNYLAMISANIRLFEQQKITEEEMTRQNRRICKAIEVKSETIRRQRASHLPPDVTFEYLSRSNPAGSGVVFVQILANDVMIYIPATGAKRRVPINASDEKSRLFQPKFLDGIAELLNSDKKAKQPSILKQTKVYETAAESLFGELLPWLNKRRVVIQPDDESFSSQRIFGKNTKGALVTTNPGPNSIVIVASVDTQSIPFESLLPNSLVIRTPNYLSLLLKPFQGTVSTPKIPRPVICWSRSDSIGKRSANCAMRILARFSGSEEPVLAVSKHSTVNIPNPICKGKEGDFVKKYEFCDFVEVSPSSLPKYLSASSALFIFTYADLCEMNNLVSTLTHQYPFASFMFIPEPSMRDAFHELRSIFERHVRRQTSGKSHQVLDDPLTFASTLKLTLERSLKVPIPLVTHAH